MDFCGQGLIWVRHLAPAERVVRPRNRRRSCACSAARISTTTLTMPFASLCSRVSSASSSAAAHNTVRMSKPTCVIPASRVTNFTQGPRHHRQGIRQLAHAPLGRLDLVALQHVSRSARSASRQASCALARAASPTLHSAARSPRTGRRSPSLRPTRIRSCGRSIRPLHCSRTPA